MYRWKSFYFHFIFTAYGRNRFIDSESKYESRKNLEEGKVGIIYLILLEINLIYGVNKIRLLQISEVKFEIKKQPTLGSYV